MFHPIFLYCTLRRGEINDVEQLARRLDLPAPAYLGSGRVWGKLVDFGDWPGLIPTTPPAGRAILGDVYEVGEGLLAAMDEVEEYVPGNDSVFLRRQTQVELGGRQVKCFFYPIDPALRGDAPVIDADDWITWRQTRGAA